MAEQAKTVQLNEEKKIAPWYTHLAQPLAILFWLYAVTQIFIYDLDAFLESSFPFVA